MPARALALDLPLRYERRSEVVPLAAHRRIRRHRRRLPDAGATRRQHGTRCDPCRAAPRRVRAELPGCDRRDAQQGDDPGAGHEPALRAAAARRIHGRRIGLRPACHLHGRLRGRRYRLRRRR